MYRFKKLFEGWARATKKEHLPALLAKKMRLKKCHNKLERFISLVDYLFLAKAGACQSEAPTYLACKS